MAIGGIIGTDNYQYCLFGDTVKIVGFEYLYSFIYELYFQAGEITNQSQVNVIQKY